MKKKLLTTILAASTLVMASVPAYAKNNADTKLPEKFIGYAYSQAANTGVRAKEDSTYHYIWNQSGFSLWVRSMDSTGKKNLTTKDHAVIREGRYFISNQVYEKGYRKCKLNITTATAGTSGYLKGFWSPDSVGHYPVANPM